MNELTFMLILVAEEDLTQAQLSSSKGWTNCSMPLTARLILTSPALMQHALTVASGHKVFLLGIFDWLSKSKSMEIATKVRQARFFFLTKVAVQVHLRIISTPR